MEFKLYCTPGQTSYNVVEVAGRDKLFVGNALWFKQIVLSDFPMGKEILLSTFSGDGIVGVEVKTYGVLPGVVSELRLEVNGDSYTTVLPLSPKGEWTEPWPIWTMFFIDKKPIPTALAAAGGGALALLGSLIFRKK